MFLIFPKKSKNLQMMTNLRKKIAKKGKAEIHEIF